MLSHHILGVIQCLISKIYLFLTFFIIFLQRYGLLAEILLTAAKRDAASQYTERLVILVNIVYF